MNNYLSSHKIPQGLGMALAENIEAMRYFSSLTENQQNDIIDHTHQICSKQEMHQFVNSFFKF